MPLDYRVLELTTIRYLELKDNNKFSKSAAMIASKAISVTKLNIPYDRAKCIHLPETPPWQRNHPQEIQSASSKTFTSADPSTTRIFIDGSIHKNGAGFSVLICFTSELNHSISGSLPRHTTIFQAEGFAILAALECIVSTRPLPSQKYEIFSDSKSALAASTPSESSNSSQPFSSITQILATYGANIKLFWIPSHSGHPGNDMADSIAKSAAQSWSSYHSSLPLTKSYAKNEIFIYVNTLWDDEWRSTNAGKSTRAFFPSVNSAKILNTFTLAYQNNQLLSGHCRLNGYQYRFKHISSPLCCGLTDEETVEHFILICPNFSIHREPLTRTAFELKLTWPPNLHVFTQSKVLLQALNAFTIKTQRLNLPTTSV